MSGLGKNMKLTVARDRREALTATLERLGASTMSPEPDLVLYRFPDGFNLGVYYVDAQGSLTEAQLRLGPWLEIVVDAPDQVGEALLGAGVARVEYDRSPHLYLQLPGGPVFRLAGPGD